MNNDNEIQNTADIISRVFINIDPELAEKNNKIVSSWKNLLQKIKYDGQNLADHSRVIDLKNGILLIETDHPGWIQMLQLHKKIIISGLHKTFPQLKIDSLAFRLKGTNVGLAAVNKKRAETEQQKYMDSVEREQKILEERGFGNDTVNKRTEKQELPLDLQNLFNSLKQTMLTNTKK